MSQQTLLSDKYIFDKKIGSGSFGEVFLVTDILTNEKMALKIEEKKKASMLVDEYKIYNKLFASGFTDGLPKVYAFINTPMYNIMVMELLDKSLESLFNKYNKVFQLHTVLRLAVDIISLLEKLHDADIIHRDIKPNNFMIGVGKNSNKLYIMDFGLSKKYINKGQHISYTTDRSLIGTARYASVNVHLGMEPSRRDDLESVGYMLIYFAKGKLPWQGLKKETGVNHLENIGIVKLCTNIDKLCDDLPNCFKTYISYCQSLKFEEKPDYQYLRNLFIEASVDNKLELKYEWEN